MLFLRRCAHRPFSIGGARFLLSLVASDTGGGGGSMIRTFIITDSKGGTYLRDEDYDGPVSDPIDLGNRIVYKKLDQEVMEPVKIGPEERDPDWIRDDLIIALRGAVHGFVAVCDEAALGQIADLLYPVNSFAFAALSDPQRNQMTILVRAFGDILRFDRDQAAKVAVEGETVAQGDTGAENISQGQ